MSEQLTNQEVTDQVRDLRLKAMEVDKRVIDDGDVVSNRNLQGISGGTEGRGGRNVHREWAGNYLRGGRITTENSGERILAERNDSERWINSSKDQNGKASTHMTISREGKTKTLISDNPTVHNMVAQSAIKSVKKQIETQRQDFKNQLKEKDYHPLRHS